MGLAHFRYGFTICFVRNEAPPREPERARHDKAPAEAPTSARFVPVAVS